jgi:hypothetical protein
MGTWFKSVWIEKAVGTREMRMRTFFLLLPHDGSLVFLGASELSARLGVLLFLQCLSALMLVTQV